MSKNLFISILTVLLIFLFVGSLTFIFIPTGTSEYIEPEETESDNEDTFMEENRDRIILYSATLGLVLALIEIYRIVKKNIGGW